MADSSPYSPSSGTADTPAEAALRESGRLARLRLAELEATYATAPVGLCVLDTDLRFVRVNQHLAEINGVSVEDHIGRTVREVLPDLADEVEPVFHRILETGEPVLDYELTGETASQPGVQRTWLESWYPLRDEDGQVIGINIVADEVTEKKRADAALHESAAQRRLALDVAEVGTWEWNLVTGEGHLDARGAEIVGLSPGPVPDIAAAQSTVIHPDDLAGLGAQVDAGLSGGGTFDIRYRIVHPDGGVRYVHSRARVVADADGRPVRLIGTNRDVTAEREAEAALRESEERYRTLFESLDEGFCVIEVLFDDGEPVDYRFLVTNRAFEGQTGLRDVVGKRMRELEPNHEHYWFEIYGRVAQTHQPERFTNRAEHLNRWYDVYAFPVDEPEEHRVGILFSDITERKRQEDALRESEAHLRRVIDNMVGFVAVTDVDGAFLDVNRAALQLGGLSREDVVGTKFWETYWWNHDPKVSARLEAAFQRAAEGETARFDIEARTADDGRITADFMLTPVRDPDGEILYLIPSGVDVTARARAEEAVRRLNETLEERVEERTTQVRRLAAQLTVAEQEERQRIAQVLHDDIQQQLYGLSILLPLLMRSPADEADRLLSRAESVLSEAMTLTRSLSTELSPSVLDSDRLEDSLQWLAERKRQLYGLAVEVVMDGPCSVSNPTTRTLLYQTLREVLFNVVKHADVAEARVVVEECGDEIVVGVEDDGRGFDPEAHTGGFGLSNVRSRLELVGGRFEIDSAPGRGTQVRLVLPGNRA